MTRTLFAMAALALFAASSAIAAEAFVQVDTNADGALSMEEVAKAFPDTTADQFKAADTDGSGTLSEAEFAAAVPASGATTTTQ